MSPMRADTIRRTLEDGTRVEHQKPVYFCDCGAFGHFGLTVTDEVGHRTREWFCGWLDGEPICKGKGNGTGQ